MLVNLQTYKIVRFNGSLFSNQPNHGFQDRFKNVFLEYIIRKNQSLAPFSHNTQ